MWTVNQMPSLPESWRNAPISRRSLVLGAGAIGAFLAVDLGAVSYANNWIGNRITRQEIIDIFQSISGAHRGFRRNHAKGVAVAGYFDSNGEAMKLSRAAVLRVGRSPVMGRFSLSGGNPFVYDTPGAGRGLGLAIGFPGQRQWRTAMVNLPVFPVNSPDGFIAQLLASKPDPVTGKPDPAAMARLAVDHPETVAAMEIIKQYPPTSGFADSTFRGLNTFYFVSESGTRTPIRWSFTPHQNALTAQKGSANMLFDALVRQLRTGQLRWDLQLVVGEPGDPVDPTLPWPADRKVVNAGVLVLDSVQTEMLGNARDVNFDPLVLPDGIEPSDDPILSTRSAVYAASHRARSGEPKSPSAVQVDGVTR
jgi:catalase